MHFPANAGLIYLTDELTNNRYLVDTGATLSIVPCNQNSSPSGPLLKGADGQPIPSWGFTKKTVQFQGKFFTSSFLQAAVAGPILGIDFLRKFASHCCSRDQANPDCLHCSDLARPLFVCSSLTRPFFAFSGLAHLTFPAYSSSGASSVPIHLPAATTSFQPPAMSTHVVWNPEGEVVQL
jgi:hypothetical protein